VIVRMPHHEATKAYFARRTTEGKSRRRVICCLKRKVIREVCRHIKVDPRAGEITN